MTKKKHKRAGRPKEGRRRVDYYILPESIRKIKSRVDKGDPTLSSCGKVIELAIDNLSDV